MQIIRRINQAIDSGIEKYYAVIGVILRRLTWLSNLCIAVVSMMLCLALVWREPIALITVGNALTSDEKFTIVLAWLVRVFIVFSVGCAATKTAYEQILISPRFQPMIEKLNQMREERERRKNP